MKDGIYPQSITSKGKNSPQSATSKGEKNPALTISEGKMSNIIHGISKIKDSILYLHAAMLNPVKITWL